MLLTANFCNHFVAISFIEAARVQALLSHSRIGSMFRPRNLNPSARIALNYGEKFGLSFQMRRLSLHLSLDDQLGRQ